MIPGNPHAVQLITRGIIGSTVGLSTKGYIVTLEEFIYVPPVDVPPTGAAGIRGLREEDKKKKIIVTVEAYGKKFTHEEIVSFDHKIRIKDLEIVDNGEEIVSIMISEVTKK